MLLQATIEHKLGITGPTSRPLVGTWTMRDDRRPRELRELLEQKYRRCQRFREKLKATGEANILHSVKDLKWGIGLHTTDICHPLDPKSTKGQKPIRYFAHGDQKQIGKPKNSS
jgi:predicted NAD-dependent protein-ADP-ribosyltransferase YbiA (DUF1768 family)